MTARTRGDCSRSRWQLIQYCRLQIDLVGQHPLEFGIAAGNEIGQHAKAEPVSCGRQLREDAGTLKLRLDARMHVTEIVEPGREDHFLDIADEWMLSRSSREVIGALLAR
jgi:hypothetical protein